MHRCLELAAKAEGKVAPNPLVGCVVVYNNKIVSEGYHRAFGEPHAEVNAFSKLSKHINTKECDVYVSLEPCSHFGKTPPCSNLIIRKKPRKVFVAVLDPNPQVAGTGIERIKAAGIEVEVGLLEDEAKKLNKTFFHFHRHKTPYITLKWAETADGVIGRLPESTASKQISDERNKAFVHRIRANNQAIVVGYNTYVQDNPQLNVRCWIGNNPVKIVLTKKHRSEFPKSDFIAFEDIDKMILGLSSQNIQSVLVEGGAEILNQFIATNNWNEAVVLKSSENWDRGVKAPVLQKKEAYSHTLHGDTIHYYFN